jgi:hypothetical protein
LKLVERIKEIGFIPNKKPKRIFNTEMISYKDAGRIERSLRIPA